MLNEKQKENVICVLHKIKNNGILLCGIFLLIVTFFANYPSALSAISKATGKNSKELPIYCVKTEKKQVALSFDAAWGNDDTQTILDILDKYNVKVTFFMTGGWVESYPDDVKKIAEAGHDLGNHSENHKNMSQLSVEECEEEIMEVHNKVKELTGLEMELFRPPYSNGV